MERPRICVVGGTGLLGAPVVRALLVRGFRTRIVARNPFRSDLARLEGVEMIAADVRDPHAIRSALEGCSGVHLSLRGGPHPEDTLTIEAEGGENVVRAARECGVEWVTMLSSLSAAMITDEVLENRVHVPAPVFAKYCAERSVREGGIPYTIFRPSNFIDGLERSVAGRRAFIPSGAESCFHWLAAAEFAELVAGVHERHDLRDVTCPVFGPEEYTIEEAMRIYLAALRPDCRLVRRSRLMMGMIALFNPGLRMELEMLAFTRGLDEDELLLPGRENLIPLHVTIHEYLSPRCAMALEDHR